MVTNTNYHVNYDLVEQKSPRQSFSTAKRIIGDIKDTDYSLPFI